MAGWRKCKPKRKERVGWEECGRLGFVQEMGGKIRSVVFKIGSSKKKAMGNSVTQGMDVARSVVYIVEGINRQAHG